MRFDAAARTYEEAAGLQADVAARVIGLIPPGFEPGRALDVGSGTGILLRLLHGKFPRADITALDLSTEMLAHARDRHPRPADIHWIAHGGGQ